VDPHNNNNKYYCFFDSQSPIDADHPERARPVSRSVDGLDRVDLIGIMNVALIVDTPRASRRRAEPDERASVAVACSEPVDDNL